MSPPKVHEYTTEDLVGWWSVLALGVAFTFVGAAAIWWALPLLGAPALGYWQLYALLLLFRVAATPARRHEPDKSKWPEQLGALAGSLFLLAVVVGVIGVAT